MKNNYYKIVFFINFRQWLNSEFREERFEEKILFLKNYFYFVIFGRAAKFFRPPSKLSDHCCQNRFRRVQKNCLRKSLLLNKLFLCFSRIWTLSNRLPNLRRNIFRTSDELLSKLLPELHSTSPEKRFEVTFHLEVLFIVFGHWAKFFRVSVEFF